MKFSRFQNLYEAHMEWRFHQKSQYQSRHIHFRRNTIDAIGLTHARKHIKASHIIIIST